jgi:hypothetical protein
MQKGRTKEQTSANIRDMELKGLCVQIDFWSTKLVGELSYTADLGLSSEAKFVIGKIVNISKEMEEISKR